LKNDIQQYFKENLTMYPHLKNIRDKLWAKDGKSRVSVMVGAGFSLNAKKVDSTFQPMALWSELRNRLLIELTHCEKIEMKDVLELGQLYVEEYGRSSLDELLKESIPDENYEPGDLHNKLLNLPWADVYTTNYDTLLERTKKHVFQRNYQIIYDINDIPSSTQPRIVKLHGSFPAMRPFVFTKKDYEEYPNSFSPFVNMVQQSIMETTLVLIGFSGDDPNFNKWTTWVLNNLGEHKPKIYMIGFNESHRFSDLKEKGITLIDFHELYKNEDNPYQLMYHDIFKFLEFKSREEKTKWPHLSYANFNFSIDDYIYNRKTYPGWVVMPDEIRRKYAERIRFTTRDFFDTLSSLDDPKTILTLNEILWCYDKFLIPFDYYIHQKLRKFIENIETFNSNLHPLILRLLKEARLDFNGDEFKTLLDLLKNMSLSRDEKSNLYYEQVLYHFSLNEIEYVEELLSDWELDEQEIEWGIKKATIYARINNKNKALEMFKNLLQITRSLLVINVNDFRLLSLESVALHNIIRLSNDGESSYDRLQFLSNKFCDCNKEFNRTLLSLKPYENTYGMKRTNGFDPGIETVSTSFGNSLEQEILDSYTVISIQENYGFSINDSSLFEIAIKNIELFYPIYSRVHMIHKLRLSNIKELISREFVYQIDNESISTFVKILEKALKNNNKSIIEVTTSLEIISRIYFALPADETIKLDKKIIDYIRNKSFFNYQETEALSNLIKRIIFTKNTVEAQEFCSQLIQIRLISQMNSDNSLFLQSFFEPFLVIFGEHRVLNIDVDEEILSYLLKEIKNSSDYSKSEAALIRLTFLTRNNCLPKTYLAEFKKILQNLPYNMQYGISNFVYSSVFDMIINSSRIASINEIEKFLIKEIPKFHHGHTTSASSSLTDYFREMSNIFIDFVGINQSNLITPIYYDQWLDKFFIWWENQKDGLFRDSKHDLFPISDYLTTVVSILKNNILCNISTDFLNNDKKEFLLKVFQEIEQFRPDLILYLVPVYNKLKIDIQITLDNVLDQLYNHNTKNLMVVVKVLYDYLIFIATKEIDEDSSKIKSELFNILKYGKDTVLIQVIKTLQYALKNANSIFSNSDYQIIIKCANNFLTGIKEGKLNISRMNDFSLVDSYTGLVARLAENNLLNNEDYTNWEEFIRNHRLPEVYRNIDAFNKINKNDTSNTLVIH